MKNNIKNYFTGSAVITVFFLISLNSEIIFNFFEKSAESEMLLIFFHTASLFLISFAVFYVSSVFKLPSFVLAIFFGIASKNLLEPIIENHLILGVLVGLGATLILFGGGIETPYANFKKLAIKIFSLSFPGLLTTAILFSFFSFFAAKFIGNEITVISAVLLGAVLASTDPAAIIPVLKKLRFHNRSIKDIIVSESAVTDVSGTLLTIVFISIALAKTPLNSITEWYMQIFTPTNGAVLLRQIFFGVLFGIIGWGLLEMLSKFKINHNKEHEVDSAFFLFVPIIIFPITVALGGSGYLAAFVSGLLFSLTEHLHETEKFFNHTIEGFLKPMIFILLGALVDPASLLKFAPIGIIASLGFMFIIRPITVFLFLGPFKFFGQDRLNWREMAFISFIRETGAIPAVLIVTVASLKISGIDGFTEIGMWVILSTLIIEPIFTPFVAKKLKLAEIIEDSHKIILKNGSKVILVTRGESFLDRLPIVIEWTKRHSISTITVLLCLEDKYSDELSGEIEVKAAKKFQELNEKIISQNEQEINFNFISRKGFLNTNIETIAEENKNVIAIFVGKKMLDFRLNEIKSLSIPLYFID